MNHPTRLDIARWAAEAGLDAHGVTDASPFVEARHQIEARKAAGLHAGMHFTYGRPERSTDPGRLLPGAASIVVGALAYHRASTSRASTGTHAAVARYVWEPFYGQLGEGLEHIASQLRVLGHEAVVAVDDNRMVDRAAAYRAGLGWFGKNTNLLLGDLGSWFVLGAVVTTAIIDPAPAAMADGCASCTRCQTGCPTGALDVAGQLDARRCLAWLVQADGIFPVEFRVALGDRIYGCDDCQTVCPPNTKRVRLLPSPHVDSAARTTVDVLELLALDDAELMERFGAWYIPRRRPEYLRRNAAVVLANVARPQDAGQSDPQLVAALERLVSSASVIEAAHGVWAARRLGYDEVLAPLINADRPLAAEVMAELERPVPPRSSKSPAGPPSGPTGR